MPQIISQEERIKELEKKLSLQQKDFDSLNIELKKANDILDLLEETSKAITSEIELEKLVQRITDKATQLSGAEFGAFFYNALNDEGELYTLYTISGVPKEAFSKFPMPRNTKIFSPTFAGEKIIRYDDVTKEKNYGQNAPYHGMPKGHLPVKSYLAVPVISPITKEVIGGLFFGHSQPAMFNETVEKIVQGIAVQGAIAMGNAKLFEEKKVTESLLSEQTDIYKSIFNSTFDGVFILNNEGDIVEANEMAAEMFDLPHPELKKKNIKKILQSYDPRFLNFKFLKNEGNFYFQSHAVKNNGEGMELECRARLFLLKNTPHLLLLMKDITQVLLAESELRKSRNFSDTIAETSPVALFLTNNKGELNFMNSLWMEWTGVEHFDNHKGFRWLEYIFEEDQDHFLDAFRKAFTNKNNLDIDVRINTGNGSPKWVNIQAEPYKDHDNFFSGLAGSIMDISLRKNAEEKLREKEIEEKGKLEILVKERTAQLEKINYELLQFTSIASHDLKEPIRKISIFSKILKDRIYSSLEEGNQRYLNTIIDSAGRMTSLINDLLSFSRLSHIEETNFSSIDLNKVIFAITKDLELLIEEKHASFEIDKLPNIEGIELQISQVFQNLISNSLKFKNPEKPLKIRIHHQISNDNICRIVYSDSGMGFNNKYNEKIFEVFQRLHTRDKVEGTGIGLSIVKKIITLHKGKIEAKGEEGVGATFFISIPCKQKSR